MICEKTHVTEASFMSLVREREELMQEVEIIRAGRDRDIAAARDRALEDAAKQCEGIAQRVQEDQHRRGLIRRADIAATAIATAAIATTTKCAAEIRALKGNA